MFFQLPTVLKAHLTYTELHHLCSATCLCMCTYTYKHTHAYPLWTTSSERVWLVFHLLLDGDRFEYALKVYWRSRGLTPIILNLGARRRLVVYLVPRPLYPRRKSCRYQLKSRMVEPHSRSGRVGEENNVLPTAVFGHKSTFISTNIYF